ncbi:hypothetical protein [Mucilaginibacter sp.]|uniref:hypothetical protein n=1 Tax=Mucilaginibacter sp. TaxID=1882438 RepID=UPI0028488CB4|nr:hypothetical protein [Mucilaginibacter sp.]MDR3697329.1 hypothetical protein [Mucilaginibacter sp.]
MTAIFFVQVPGLMLLASTDKRQCLVSDERVTLPYAQSFRGRGGDANVVKNARKPYLKKHFSNIIFILTFAG